MSVQVRSTSRSSSSTKPTIPVGIVIAAVVIVVLIAGYFIFQSLNASVAAPEVTASGGNGRVQTYGATFNVRITAKQDGPNCNYTPFWSDGTQIGSAFSYPCNEDGYQQLLKYLYDNGKIPKAIYEALKGVKFW